MLYHVAKNVGSGVFLGVQVIGPLPNTSISITAFLIITYCSVCDNQNKILSKFYRLVQKMGSYKQKHSSELEVSILFYLFISMSIYFCFLVASKINTCICISSMSFV